ncbi:hypothetical protein [Caulobacter vibrioides]|uniref:Uncharacterized protein n=1 Tax=Caulobacter vibrioides (strain NA1000 / CB15N) TaxID=565050 RepID=A0A0H3C9Y6_CAUVN|nr:hypothetical protein [Caulobacter vibrioides]YP_002518147.2 hypothetical protein CCNA_02774 [Caulobacter vibrioides NA1000]ACL96239.2 hypothetical protein CCNA_02774 [Caulobacter vibrioides NA1000]QXZ54003.1 hypothetical protein KZH45_14300 [Caulobacter vibrioides]
MFGWFKKRLAQPPGSLGRQQVSSRLVEQRVRNRIMEELASLAEGETAVRHWGAGDYFGSFFDWFPTGCDAPPQNSTMTGKEHQALSEVLDLMRRASAATVEMVDEEDLIGSGWPARIAASADEALRLFRERGAFSDDQEEEAPSRPAGPHVH